MKKSMLVLGVPIILGALFGPPVGARAEDRMWVAIEDLKRRTCPSTECGIVGRFFFRESVIVFEQSHEWSRVSRYHSAGCYDGKSAFVESGSPECLAENGIEGGEFAEWVKSEFLVEKRPERPAPIQG